MNGMSLSVHIRPAQSTWYLWRAADAEKAARTSTKKK